MAGKHPSDISNLVLHFRGDGTIYNAHTGTTDAVNAGDAGNWLDEVESFSVSQATASRRPHYYDYVIGGQPGLVFFGTDGESVLTGGAKAITGDMTIACMTTGSDASGNNAGSFVQHGDGETSATQELYDIRRSNGNAGWFHEYSGGQNEIVESTISMPKQPVSFIARRDATGTDIDFNIGGSTQTVSYTNNTSGGASGELSIGAFETGSSVLNETVGGICEAAIFDRRLTDEEVVQLERYFQQRYEQRKFSISEDSNWSLARSNDVQAIYTDGVKLWVLHSDFIYKYPVAGGAADDSRDTSGDGIGLTSWGGAYVHNDELHMVRFSASVASEIWKISATSFASAPTQVKVLSDLPRNGVNGLVRMPNGKWICGFTDNQTRTGPNELYVLDSSFVHESTIAWGGAQDWGIQDLTVGPNGEVYGSGHGEGGRADLFRFRWDGSTLFQQWQFAVSHDNQGVAYADGVFYTADRNSPGNDTVRLHTLTAPHDDERRLIHHRDYPFRDTGIFQR